MKTKLYKIECDAEFYWCASILSEKQVKTVFLDESGEDSIDEINEITSDKWNELKFNMDEYEDNGDQVIMTAKELVSETMNEDYPFEIIGSTNY
jgi:DNA phosphorothioation-dependent restriction protein DptG